MPTQTKRLKNKPRIECQRCFDEDGSYGCIRPSHTEAAWMSKKDRMEAAHKAFGAWIKKSYSVFDLFDEDTLNRDENGNYTNMSVIMDCDDWFNGWCSALKFAKIIK